MQRNDVKGASKATNTSLEDLVQKNVEAIHRIEMAAESHRTRSDMVADAVAGFCGSTAFVYVHLVWFGSWLAINSIPTIPKAYRWDVPPFNMLTLVVSLEAIFLSTFILVSQNRQQKTADQRNHLDLQINLLAEQESSQMLAMMRRMMEHLKIPLDPEMAQPLHQTTDPERLAQQIQSSAIENNLPTPSPKPSKDHDA